MMPMRSFLLFASLIALAACGGSKETAQPKREPLKVPDVYKVKMVTTKGDIVVEVRRDWAPRGADHFYGLVHDKFYDGVKFHRVIRNFAAQFGINPDMKRDELWRSIKLPDDPVKQKNTKGTLTYAISGPNSRTTQLFFNLRDNSATLDKAGFAPIGYVVEGLNVVEDITFVYGDHQPRGTGPDPREIQTKGYSYLEREFPRLDTIKSASIVLP
jgi:peptidyl-prolyl cis-trans isomerase A (cyclophilin A)